MQARSMERVTAFTDGVLAIALTLLVLPLVDISREVTETGLAGLLADHLSDFLAFLISFFVILQMWRVHRQIFEAADSCDEGLLTLNGCWLLGVVFLPVPTALLTFGSQSARTTVLYLANLLFITVFGMLMSTWINRRPKLWSPAGGRLSAQSVRRSLVVCAFIAAAAALSAFLQSLALIILAFMPLAQRMSDRAHPAPPAPAGTPPGGP